jgi:hypothetical protein
LYLSGASSILPPKTDVDAINPIMADIINGVVYQGQEFSINTQKGENHVPHW